MSPDSPPPPLPGTVAPDAPAGDAPVAPKCPFVRQVSVVTALIGASRALGMVREYFIILFFNQARWVSDAFLFAFSIPNLFRNLLGEGALSASFQPTFVQAREADAKTGGTGAAALAGQAASLLVAVAGALCALGAAGCLLAQWLLPVSDAARLMLTLTAVMFPFMALVCLAALFSTMLQGMKKFALPAALSILLNLAFLAAFAWIYYRIAGGDLSTLIGHGTIEEGTAGSVARPPAVSAAYVLALSVLVAGVAQVVLAWGRLWRLGVRVRPYLRFDHPGVAQTLRAFGPTALGLGVVQFNVLIDGAIAYWLSVYPGGVGARTYLHTGATFMQLPLALFGTAVATTAFPYFSQHVARGEYPQLLGRIGQSLKLSWTLTLPAAALLVALADPAIRLLFQRPDLAFDHVAVYRTSMSTTLYALGIGAFAAQMVLTRVFYARGDYAAPVKIAVQCVALNLILNLTLIHLPDLYRLWWDPMASQWWGVPTYCQTWGLTPEMFPFPGADGGAGRKIGEAGLALSTTLTAGVQCLLLWRRLRGGLRAEAGAAAWDGMAVDLRRGGLRLAAAAAATCLLTFWFRGSLPYEPELPMQVLRLMVPAVLGALVYVLIGLVAPVPEIEALVRRKRQEEKGG